MFKLTVASVKAKKTSGLWSDGNGLYLQVSSARTKSWIFRFMLNGRSRSMGLGSVQLVSLADARLKAIENKRLLNQNIDPLDHRDRILADRKAESLSSITFETCAERYIESHCAGWKNKKHISQWRNTLATYAHPVIGNLPVSSINTEMIMAILDPIWRTKTETASRLRGRIEMILAWATVRGFRGASNPATWRNHLDKLLPQRSKISKVKHHAAMPYDEIAEFISLLKSTNTLTARALELLILTATRTSECLNAEWSEIDVVNGLWTIPASRMKAQIEHRVPLSSLAVDLLRNLRQYSNGRYVFPNRRTSGPLSNMALLKLLHRLNVRFVTHGFRSTFRDWASECTSHSNEVCEIALAHTVKNKVESAYRRGDLLAKRKILMEDWSNFCNPNVARRSSEPH